MQIWSWHLTDPFVSSVNVTTAILEQCQFRAYNSTTSIDIKILKAQIINKIMTLKECLDSGKDYYYHWLCSMFFYDFVIFWHHNYCINYMKKFGGTNAMQL